MSVIGACLTSCYKTSVWNYHTFSVVPSVLQDNVLFHWNVAVAKSSLYKVVNAKHGPVGSYKQVVKLLNFKKYLLYFCTVNYETSFTLR
jgi:hypothetical protein